ncbi:heterokaryon incompatibility protein-domain-containing protein [Dendryphion nanum]|uniref:Heterokaryon incompatibility protein-domain-containing protein n=1 Tax=Dendryphion nanum TaxID=256645 RepID=A0A9P9IPG2_9PLEO|nr:heterokaryon incompatibility protein-domain-containing protein [Dendryphion nanum]
MDPPEAVSPQYTTYPPVYAYTDFKDPTQELRLLELKHNTDPSVPLTCKVEAYQIREAPDYIALSYVWGDISKKEQILITSDENEQTGYLGLHKIEISINLATALRRLQGLKNFEWKSKRMMVWADAICISQGNLEERSKQVRIMHKIYASAFRVWVYPVDVSAKNRTSASTAKENRTMSRRHKRFFSEAYWERAWVVQELFFANETWILYEDHEAILDFKSWKPGTPLVTDFGFFGQPPRHLQSELYHLKRIKYTELVDGSIGPHLLYNLVWQCRNRRASLAQDKIYSLMNILPTSTTIVQDYHKTPAEVYGSFMKQVIMHGSRHIPCRPLDFLATTHNIETPRNPSLPSWCPDFCEHPDTVDVLDNVPGSHSRIMSLDRQRGRVQSKNEDYQPWFYLRLRGKSDGQLTEPLNWSKAGISIPHWDLPYTPLLCVAAELDENEPDTELTIRGIRLDSIGQLDVNLPLHETKYTLGALPEDLVRSWKMFGSGVYRPTLESASLALMKTLLANSQLSDWGQTTGATALKHLVFGFNADSIDPTLPHDASTGEYLSELKACLPGWRLAVTSNGYFAKVPNLAKLEDIICVPLGSSTPLVLRDMGLGKYQLIGRCFVHGYMGGKAMFKLDIASQKVLGKKQKSELTDDDWKNLRAVVGRELESFTLI